MLGTQNDVKMLLFRSLSNRASASACKDHAVYESGVTNAVVSAVSLPNDVLISCVISII